MTASQSQTTRPDRSGPIESLPSGSPVPAADPKSGIQDQHSFLQDVTRNVSVVLECLPGALLVFDTAWKVVLQNEAARRLLSHATDICETLSSLTVDGACRNWAAELKAVLQLRQTRRFEAVIHPAAGHAETYLSLLCAPLYDPADDRVTGGIILAEDVSARISMEQRLAVSERLAAVGKLAARVAHELNNPLDGIMRYTNLARRRATESGDHKTAEYLEKAAVGLTRMAQITSTLLEFSRTTHTQFEQATINRIAEDAVSAMSGRAQDVNVTVVCNLHKEDMPVVRGSSLFQVFCNLIKNAIDAMPDSGTLTVTTRIVGRNVVVVFEDTGAGLPENTERLFDPFYTTKPSGQGTGLGLAVCKDIIERYGATITAANRPEGGARFTVTIPKRNCAKVPAPRLREPQS